MTWTVPGLGGYRNQTPTHREFTGWWKDGLWAGHWMQCEGRLDHCAWLLPQASLELSRERGVGISQGSKKKVTRNFWCLPRICTHVQCMWQPWNRSEVTQSHLTICNPMDYNPPGSSVHGIFQERILEWVVISFSWGSSQPRDWTQVSHFVGRCFYRLSLQGSTIPREVDRAFRKKRDGKQICKPSQGALPWTMISLW